MGSKSIFTEDLARHAVQNIPPDCWKDLLLGLQELLDLEQFQLLEGAGLKRDFHVSEWISGKRIPTLEKRLKISYFAIHRGLDLLELIRLGERIRRSLLVDGDWVSIADAKRVEFLTGSPTTIIGDDVFVNSCRLFPLSWNGHPIKYISLGDKVVIFYDEKRSTRPTPLILPRFFPCSKDFLVGLGIYLGEGSRNRHPKVTNSEPVIINQAITFFGLFGISIYRLKGWIQIHERSDSSFKRAKDYWIEHTSLGFQNIVEIRVRKSEGSAKVKLFGVMHLEVHSILLQLLIGTLIDSIAPIMQELPVEQQNYFLKGLFAAEGSVGIAKTGSVNEIRFTSTRVEERNLVRTLLGNLGVISKDYPFQFDVRIHGFNNLKRLADLDIFEYHPERREKLTIGIRNLQRSLKIS